MAIPTRAQPRSTRYCYGEKILSAPWYFVCVGTGLQVLPVASKLGTAHKWGEKKGGTVYGHVEPEVLVPTIRFE
jgi:hypothetical protein